MKHYDTLSEAVEDLKRRGYSEDFSLKPHCIECASRNLQLHPEDFVVEEFHRFEGASNPDDNSIVYAVSGERNGIKGILVDAYGVYAEKLSPEMISRLRLIHT